MEHPAVWLKTCVSCQHALRVRAFFYCVVQHAAEPWKSSKANMAGMARDESQPSLQQNLIFKNEFKGQTNVNDVKLLVRTAFVGSWEQSLDVFDWIFFNAENHSVLSRSWSQKQLCFLLCPSSALPTLTYSRWNKSSISAEIDSTEFRPGKQNLILL